MCEWLSSQEWFDVQLFCGGRTFNAHRAVLASVSTFLRQILLSCSTEDSPVFIVLPDFDIEAMSSVLYYIYNGEVTIQRDKYEMFLDIIKAMQIFMDSKYLHRTKADDVDGPHYDSVESNIFYSNAGISKNSFDIATKIINLKKEQHHEATSLKQSYFVSETNLCTDHVLCQDLSKLQKPLENLQLPFIDRQRNSFLRDLFIETHPGNGYVNGRAEGVLEISSECYQEPRSLLLTNTNGHLQARGSLSNRMQHLPHTVTNNNSLCKGFRGCELEHKANLMNYLYPQKFNPGVDYTISQLDCSTIKFGQFSQNTKLLHRTVKDISMPRKKNLNICSKSVILNQVLESPWCSHPPNNYRPLCKNIREKEAGVSVFNKKFVKEATHDGNNNIDRNNSKISLTVDDPLTNFKCTICGQVLPTRGALAAHVKLHSSGARYTCKECFKSFSQLRNFKYHMSVHRGTREFAATCPVCGKYFNDRGYLSSHMKIHRNRKEYKCTMCPKSFNQRVAYNMHVRIHTGVKPHICEECGKAFSRKMLLKQHQRTHSGERPYACPHCDKRFADRSNMTLHLRLHSGIKPFSCTLCPKSFTKKHHLKSHINFHTGIKPYSCPRCKLAFTQSSNMRTHLKKCSGPMPLDVKI